MRWKWSRCQQCGVHCSPSKEHCSVSLCPVSCLRSIFRCCCSGETPPRYKCIAVSSRWQLWQRPENIWIWVSWWRFWTPKWLGYLCMILRKTWLSRAVCRVICTDEMTEWSIKPTKGVPIEWEMTLDPSDLLKASGITFTSLLVPCLQKGW